MWNFQESLEYLELGNDNSGLFIEELINNISLIMPTTLTSIFQLNSRYLSAGMLTRRQHHSFVRYETLRKEYLNQTFNFMPELQTLYDENSKGQNYEEAQRQITEKEDYSQLGKV